MKGVWLQDLTWPEAEEWIASGHPVVVPVGAISKEHGYHLPMNTDYLFAKALAQGVAEALPVVIAPIITSGYYPAFRHYPGSQHLSAGTFQSVIEETLENFIDQGAENLAIINTGVSTEPVIKVAVREILEDYGIRVPVADILRLGKSADVEFGQKLGGHGDEQETSVILAVKPEAVRMELAQEDYGHTPDMPKTVFYTPVTFDSDSQTGPDYSATGVKGDPTLATPEKGQAVLDAMVNELVEGLTALFPDILP